MDASNLALLVPVSKHGKSRESYSALQQYFSTSGCTVILGLDEEDSAGRMALANEHVVTLMPGGALCTLWNDMALAAFSHGVVAVLMLGDDITVETSFKELVNEVLQLLNAGWHCISVSELIGGPSWPSFIATTSKHTCGPALHYDFIPKPFVNQEADLYLFEKHRRCGVATHTSNIHLYNAIGGVEGGLKSPASAPRYMRKSIDWRKHLPRTATIRTIDICVPSVRASVDCAKELLALPYDPTYADVRIVICFDGEHNLSQSTMSAMREYELSQPRLRVRVNQQNCGAPATRDRLFKESHSEWVLFIDDDVKPTKRLLNEYIEAIRATSDDINGLLGVSTMPRDGRLWTDAVHLCGVTHFWHGAKLFGHLQPMPWTVSANVMLRHSNVTFDKRFPRSGGGEDIDFLIKSGAAHGKLLAVPGAEVEHPWRTTPWQMFARMTEWAVGDGYLNFLYPEHRFFCPPTLPEALLYFMPLAILKKDLVLLLLPCIAEVVSQAIFLMVTYNDGWVLSSQRSKLRKAMISALATIPLNASEIGHLIGHIKRLHIHLICTRFDFHLGFLGNAPKEEERKKRWAFVFLTFLLFVVRYLV